MSPARPLPTAARLCCAALVVLVCGAVALAEGAKVHLGQFEKGRKDGWEVEDLEGETDYEFVEIAPGRKALKATADGTAGGWTREREVNLEKTPVLHWRWRVDDLPADVDQRTKDGDDFPVRMYVIVKGGWAFWKTRAICYVWATEEKVGERWENPFSDKAMMWVVDSGRDKTGRWVEHSRNVRDDLEKAFDDEFDAIDAVAIMTDGDNSDRKLVGWYGDIWFAAE